MPKLVKAEDLIARALLRVPAETHALILYALNEGWKMIAPRVGNRDRTIASARLELANAVLELASSVRDAKALKDAALRSAGRLSKRKDRA